MSIYYNLMQPLCLKTTQLIIKFIWKHKEKKNNKESVEKEYEWPASPRKY